MAVFQASHISPDEAYQPWALENVPRSSTFLLSRVKWKVIATAIQSDREMTDILGYNVLITSVCCEHSDLTDLLILRSVSGPFLSYAVLLHLP